MKQEAYVAGVAAIYRKYLDLYENHPNGDYRVSSEDYQKLLDLGNRSGFTDGYYKRHNGRDMVTFHKPSHEKNSDALQTGSVIHSDIQKKKETMEQLTVLLQKQLCVCFILIIGRSKVRKWELT